MNILEIRSKDWERIIPTIKKMFIPFQELGYKTDIHIEPYFRSDRNDLAPTLKDKVSIKIEKDGKETDLSFFLPKLIDGKYFVVNGKKKIGQFQLFDVPHVKRNLSLVTNCGNIHILKRKEDKQLSVTWLGKLVPIPLLYLCKFTKEECQEKLDYWKSIEVDDDVIDPVFDDFIDSFENYLSQNSSKAELLKELGSIYTNYNTKKKANAAVFAIDLLRKIDVWIQPFLKHDCILDDIVEVMFVNYDDTNLYSKRVRFVEYLLSSFTKAIFNFCIDINCNTNGKKRIKVNFSKTQILNELNSAIVQFDFSVNPVQELTLLSRISPLGPGGFERGSVPTDYRDISPTMFGRICPVDTPDRDNCGVVQSLLPEVELDDNLRFSKEPVNCNNPTSIPVRLVPFLEHDDQTRLQMASSQMRQSIVLQDLKPPLVQTGQEKKFAPYTWFLTKAKDDGKVLFKCNEFMIVKYVSGEEETIPLGFQSYTENFNYVQCVLEDDNFKKNDIIARSPSCINGGIVTGKDLLTAIMPWYGYNFEDGIVISDRLVKEDVLSSIHYCNLSFSLGPQDVLVSLKEDKYVPLPLVGDTVIAGEPYAIVKTIPNIIKTRDIFEDCKYKTAEHNCVITNIQVYPNYNYNKDIPEFRDWIEITSSIQKSEITKLERQLEKIGCSKEDIETIKRRFGYSFNGITTYKNKREPLTNTFIKIEAVYSKRIEACDKLANRHGNKGEVSKIVDHTLMPQLEDGSHIDVCLNPLGIISRMNVGQLFELHLGMAVHKLKENSLLILKEKGEEETRKYISGFYDILSETNNLDIKDKITNQPINKNVIENLYVEEEPFSSSSKDQIMRALEYVGAKTRYELIDPVSKRKIVNPIAVGYMNISKLVHMAETKLAARSTGPYAKKTLQPLGGRKNHGAQRCGEMETMALVGHGCVENLYEFITTKSDSINAKSEYLKRLISSREIAEETDNTPESVKLLESYFKLIGVEND